MLCYSNNSVLKLHLAFIDVGLVCLDIRGLGLGFAGLGLVLSP